METVLLLHCSASSGAQWRSLGAKLGSRYRVLVPDLIGYGAAAPWPGQGGFSLAKEAAAVLAGVDGPFHLVGHSYGGGVALHIARNRPERIRSLTLIEPSAFHLLRGGDETDRAALREISEVAADARDALATGDYVAGFGRFVDYWSGPGTWDAMPAEKRATFAPQLAKVVLDFHALLDERAGVDNLRALRSPTLLVQGGCTTLPSRCVCARLRAALPGAAFRVVRGAGHMLPITHRDAVDALIAEHIDTSFTHQGGNHAIRAAA